MQSYIYRHAHRESVRLPGRIADKVRRARGCWLWQGATRHGYAAIWWKGRVVIGHRLTFRLAGGRLRRNLTLDHLCRRTTCINPAHLEQVSRVENLKRAGYGGRCKV